MDRASSCTPRDRAAPSGRGCAASSAHGNQRPGGARVDSIRHARPPLDTQDQLGLGPPAAYSGSPIRSRASTTSAQERAVVEGSSRPGSCSLPVPVSGSRPPSSRGWACRWARRPVAPVTSPWRWSRSRTRDCARIDARGEVIKSLRILVGVGEELHELAPTNREPARCRPPRWRRSRPAWRAPRGSRRGRPS